MDKKIEFLIKLIITLAILFFLVFKIGISNILNTISHMNAIYLCLVIPAFIIVFFLGMINIMLLLIPLAHNLKLSDILKYYSMGWAMGLVTPARIGEFSMVYYFSKHKISIGAGMAVAFWDKLITTALYIALGFLGIMLFFYGDDFGIISFFLIIYMVLFLAVVYLLASDMGRNLIKKFLKHRVEKFRGFAGTTNIYFRKRIDLLFYNGIFTILKTVLMALISYWLFLSFGVFVPFWLVLTISTLGSIVAFIPISLSGLGVRESLVIVLYSKFGIASSFVFSNYLIINALNYTSALAILVWYMLQDRIRNFFPI